jgi:hypothetical protein
MSACSPLPVSSSSIGKLVSWKHGIHWVLGMLCLEIMPFPYSVLKCRCSYFLPLVYTVMCLAVPVGDVIDWYL